MILSQDFYTKNIASLSAIELTLAILQYNVVYEWEELNPLWPLAW